MGRVWKKRGWGEDTSAPEHSVSKDPEMKKYIQGHSTHFELTLYNRIHFPASIIFVLRNLLHTWVLFLEKASSLFFQSNTVDFKKGGSDCSDRVFYYHEDGYTVCRVFLKNHFLSTDKIFCQTSLHSIQKNDLEFINNFFLLFSSLTT